MPNFRRPKPLAFTLVELLVVIGIIALLISILLPALGRAQQQAAQVRCASQLREIFACFKQYELEHKGYWPVARINGNGSGGAYDINGFAHNTSTQGYWFNFLAKYATKNRVGNAMGANNALEAAEARRTIFYGCPAWEGYRNAPTSGEINTVQPGFGMNPYPTFTADYPGAGVSYPPALAANRPKEYAVFDINDSPRGNFLKATTWTRPAERMLVADSRFWIAASNRAPTLASYPPAVVAQPRLTNDTPGIGDVFSTGGRQTLVDIYRHGRYPKIVGTNFDPTGGKIAYNILYCDGHVRSFSDAREAYRAQRMRFPG